ncbi:hypothetical protein FB451DRAFT_5197 [Mycena latifolia]|nr:hypothetical protein FB451DRAFT_5197 [Mycena latifolia]
MAAEPQPNYNAALGAHSGVRQQTRTKVIEILAGNANGCLQELGYTPGLNERLRYLEEMNARLGAVNDDLLKKGKAWQIRAEETQVQAQALKVKCDTFKSENVKLYEDNGKLLGECDTLRTKLATAERLCAIYEQQRGRDGAELLKQYGQLAEQYAAAVRDLQRTNARIAAQPQPQPQASASQPREIRPTVVPTQVVYPSIFWTIR